MPLNFPPAWPGVFSTSSKDTIFTVWKSRLLKPSEPQAFPGRRHWPASCCALGGQAGRQQERPKMNRYLGKLSGADCRPWEPYQDITRQTGKVALSPAEPLWFWLMCQETDISLTPLRHQVLAWGDLPVSRHTAAFAEIVRRDWRIDCFPFSSGPVSLPLATDVCYNVSASCTPGLSFLYQCPLTIPDTVQMNASFSQPSGCCPSTYCAPLLVGPSATSPGLKLCSWMPMKPTAQYICLLTIL